ncbi:unnamed protein product [Mytilus coruscus]|uniref:Rho termination factor N-terminal domain-containing protein n=1 Tax=Mytilus coruscus TaxID=42192 RepID=A0A6J8AXS4_MYTCO|nr:unnamed protein product [Mytilus coruscus]
MNTIVVETVKQLKNMARNAGLKRYSRMKEYQLLELIETKTEHTFERIPKPATKKEIMIEAKQQGLKGVSRLPKNQLLTKVSEKIKKNQESMIQVHEPIRSLKSVLTTWKITPDAEMDIQTFLEETMYDIDMKNAHPTLLSCYCHDNGIKCDGLDTYNENREKYMADWMTRNNETQDDVKAHFLAIINGRRVTLTPEDPEFYSGMRLIMNSIVNLRPDLYALAKKSKDNRGTDYNIDGTTVNYVMCSLENKALMIAFEYLTEQEIEVGSLVFDGLMIYKDNVSPERLSEILKGCSQKVKEVMGCNITITNKVMDEGYDLPLDALTQSVNVELLLRKGVYPYDYMDGFEKL